MKLIFQPEHPIHKLATSDIKTESNTTCYLYFPHTNSAECWTNNQDNQNPIPIHEFLCHLQHNPNYQHLQVKLLTNYETPVLKLNFIQNQLISIIAYGNLPYTLTKILPEYNEVCLDMQDEETCIRIENNVLQENDLLILIIKVNE